MSQQAEIQPYSIEEILQILRNQAIAMPPSSTSSRYLRALESLESSALHSPLPTPSDTSDLSDAPKYQTAPQRQGGDLPIMPKPQAEAWGNPIDSSVASERRFMQESDEDNSSFIVHHLSLSLTNWLVNQWLMNIPFATASLYLDIISSLYGSAVKADLLPPTKLFSQLKSHLRTLGPQGWKKGIDDQIFDRALRLTKNAAHLIADDATAAAMVIWSLTHSLMPLTDIALLKKNDLAAKTAPSGDLSSGESQKDPSLIVNRSSLSPDSDDNNSSLIVHRSSLNRTRYAFPLRQSQRTPKQLNEHINKIVNALFRRARLPQATDPYQTVEALWAYAALRTGIPASALVAHLGHAPLGLPVLKLSVVSCQLSESGQATSNTSTNDRSSFEEVGKIFLENPPQWYAMSLRPGVRFTQVCRRIQLLGDRLPDIQLFYPCEEIARAIGKKIVTRQRPFIHSVVFFRAKLTDIGRLFSRIGDLAWCYRQSARPGVPYAHINDRQFHLFQQTIAQFTPDYEVAPAGELELRPNDRVQILGGLFSGREATVEGIAPNTASADLSSGVIYRLNIIADNGIEWRIAVDSRLTKQK